MVAGGDVDETTVVGEDPEEWEVELACAVEKVGDAGADTGLIVESPITAGMAEAK
jgi:hypothetical protein